MAVIGPGVPARPLDGVEGDGSFRPGADGNRRLPDAFVRVAFGGYTRREELEPHRRRTGIRRPRIVPVQQVGHGMPNVVIVDDQATDRQILEQLTRNLAADIDVHAFRAPSEALVWLRRHQPDLLLVDYRMPEMDGVEFIRACADIPSCTGIPIIVITVVHDAELRYRVLEAGATDFLTKPLDLQECQARCRNLLTLRRQQLIISRHARRLAEARSRTRRALRTLSLGNELLVGTQSEHELLQGICRIVADQAGYPLVWVGFWGEDDALHEVAAAGASVGAREDVGAFGAAGFLADLRAGGDAVVYNDVAAEAPGEPWAEHLRGAGFAALAVLPVRIEGLTDGILAVHTEQAGSLNQDELEMLARTADNLGYGLAAKRARRARDRAERDARFLTHFDRLTGLPNRNRLLERLRDIVEGENGPQGGAALLVINLDRFKLVNDTTGHEAGDQLLLQVVRRLQAVVRERDLLARQSGDEFALLIPAGEAPETGSGGDALADDAARAATRIIKALERPIQVAGFEYYIGASVGISRTDGMETDLQSVIRQADTAMRHAKEAGGHTFFFYTGELTERHTRRLSLEGRLHRAVQSEDFVLYYQPIMELNGDRMVGMEALLRWPQEDGSVLEPETFLPVAEEAGLMGKLGQWVFESACQQARAWADQGLDLYMSINLSLHQLLRPDLGKDLAAIMKACGASPERLELEVTEGHMMTDPTRTESIVHELHQRGLRIALDDFGVGYSSLSRLKHLPISTLKIDKDFVLGLPSDPAERMIVRTIVQLADNLGACALAEGIESARHREVLVEMGCHYGQGFYYSPARPVHELPELLARTGTG